MTRMAFTKRLALTALLAGTALVPGMAQAQTAREVELETRLKALEAAVQDLRGELNAARATAATPPRPRRPPPRPRSHPRRTICIRLLRWARLPRRRWPR